MDITHDPITLAAVQASKSSPTHIGGITYLHPGAPGVYTSPNDEVFLRSGVLSKGDSAQYPDAYALLTPYYQDWTEGASALVGAATSLGAVAQGNGTLVSTIYNSVAGNAPFVKYSTDFGVTWNTSVSTIDGSGNGYSINLLEFDQTLGLFLVVARYYDGSQTHSRILTSTNGVTWTVRFNVYGSNIQSVSRCGNLLIAVGSTGASPGYSTIWTSSDSVAWTSRMSNYNEPYANKALYTGSLYIATGSGTYTSPDAVTWTKRTTEYGTAFAVLGSEVYLASAPVIKSTTDGITWTPRLSISGVRELLVFNGVLYAITDKGFIHSTVNGTTWVKTQISDSALLGIFLIDSINQLCVYTDTNIYVLGSDGLWMQQSYSAFVIGKALPMGDYVLMFSVSGQTISSVNNTIGIPKEYFRDGAIAYMRIK